VGKSDDRPKRVRSSFHVRHIVESDAHPFVGRIFDLSIVGQHFDTYEELARYPDCKYAFDINSSVTILTRRMESLNVVGSMLWLKPLPPNFADFPVSRYEWLTISADVFLMRYISVVDCALLLTNAIYEVGLDPKKCSIDNLRKGVSAKVITHLREMLDDQGDFRAERNARFHHGEERGFTQDNTTFWVTSIIE
jgi:hypothetical protein